ncbi:MAG: helix-turn-helix domain-containing protein [Ruminococcus sp.]|jgi:transcriptional regulator with XRE-family HTH domain|nr:helix-turn-helix domain-containing protein [Ruminococcus sp.]
MSQSKSQQGGNSFARIITMLRREKGISQKKAADALGVSQALLSHYEKGIRECGLSFVVKISEFYGVSCDYLLGRSPEVTGRTLTYNDMPEEDTSKKERIAPADMMLQFNKKLINNAVNILFTLISRTKSQSLMKNASLYLMTAIYAIFRVVFISNAKNDSRFFDVPEETAYAMCSASESTLLANMVASAKGIKLSGIDICRKTEETIINSTSLSDEFPATASAILNVVKNAEAHIQILTNAER